MATRYTAKPNQMFGVNPLPTGFDKISVPNSLTIPSVGIEDVDVALFNLFNSEMQLVVNDENGIKKAPVIFASGEKWAMLKRGRALRDKQGSLILPLITIGRNNIQQTPADDQTGRGINQQQGEIVIKRRLAPEDRAYQQLINRLAIPNQENLAVNYNDVVDLITTYMINNVGQQILSNDGEPFVVSNVPGPGDQFVSRREIGDLRDGELLATNKLNNVWEIITVPSPQFFTAVYEVTIWTSYTTHMNQLLEGLISSFLPQGNSWRLETKKGYWFIASVDGNLYTPDNNFDDMSTEERLIKYKFSVKVPGYILASKTPGAPVPLRRYVSSPEVSFTISDSGTGQGVDDPFLGSDDPTLPISVDGNGRSDQREDGKTRLYPGRDMISPNDPALRSLPRGTEPARYQKIAGVDRKGNPVTKYARVKSVNRATGETTYSNLTDLSDLAIIVVDD